MNEASRHPAVSAQPRLFSLRWLLFVVLPAVALMAVVGRVYVRRAGLIKPPRPMYCNSLGITHDYQWEPAWEPSALLRDKFDRIAWADFDDNTILIVLAGEDEAFPWSLRPGLKQSQVVLGHDRALVTLDRSQDVLCIVRRDGELRHFPIGAEWARRLYDELVFQNGGTMCPDLIAATRTLLLRQDQETLDEFTADEGRGRR